MSQLDYETPQDRGTRGRIVEMLRRGDAFGWTGVGVRLLSGVGLTMLASGLFGLIFSIVACRFIGWDYCGLIFHAGAFAAAAWSFWLARRGGDNPVMDELRDYGPGPALSSGEYDMKSTTASIWGWWEMLISGPKLIFEAVARWRSRGQAPGVDLERTADAVVDLYQAGQGVKITDLLRPGDSVEGMQRILAYLEWQDWVGFSRDRRRVWLSSRVKSRVGEALSIQPARTQGRPGREP